MNRSAILLFGKYPREGYVKTRLAASIGPKAATEFYRICLQNILTDAALLESNHELDVFFYFGDRSDADDVLNMTPQNIQILTQIEASLPERIQDSFIRVFDRGYTRVCIFSTDVPMLTQDIMFGAIDKLKTSDVVIGADGDGGYYALGMHTLLPNLLDVTYGDIHKGMYEQTTKNIKSVGLSVAILPAINDVDTMDDLNFFKESHPKLWLTRYSDHMG